MFSRNTFCIKNKMLRKKVISRSIREGNKNINNVQIFQINPPITQVTLNSIEDCLNSCSKSDTFQQRVEIFYSNGIDYDKVSKYYDYVKCLNMTMKVESENENKEPSVFKKIWVCLQIVIHWIKIR